MTSPTPIADEFFDLMCDLVEDRLSPRDAARLEAMLQDDPALQRRYVDFMLVISGLHRIRGEGRATGDSGNNDECGMVNDELQTRKTGIHSSDDFPNIMVDPASLPAFPSFPSFSFSLGGFAFSYGAAAVIVMIGMLIGWAYQVSIPRSGRQEVVKSGPRAAPGGYHPEPEMVFVGCVSDMVDCRWADPSTEPFHGARVPLGRMYALSAGLMEITYDSGAKVILQGPCTYQVESTSGGYLSIGKLTARVEKRGEGRGKREENLANRQFVNGNPRHPSSLSPLSSPLFSVRTPMAVVTDLGTEFGVEVAPQEATRVCVLEGRVKLQSSAEATRVTTLEKGQSSFVDILGTVARQSEAEAATLAKTFIRSMPRKKDPGFVSLADLVAGGNGFGSRSECGIDPRNAIPVPGALQPTSFDSNGAGYKRYSGLTQIDGVFIPNGGDKPVQLDSAGHVFTLPKTNGKGFGSIWAFKCQGLGITPRAGKVSRQLAAAHPTVLLHANAGITFNLSAIRASAPNCKATRFQATVCHDVKYTDSYVADVWVFVDGQLRFSRAKLRFQDGPVEVDVPLGPNDRFLTLVSTDGGDEFWSDMILYHNPRILLETAAEQRSTSGNLMEDKHKKETPKR